MPEFQGGSNLTEMWNAITYQFIEGWPNEQPPSEHQKELIEKFLNSERYGNMTLDFYNHEIINYKNFSYSENTKVNKMIIKFELIKLYSKSKLTVFQTFHYI